MSRDRPWICFAYALALLLLLSASSAFAVSYRWSAGSYRIYVTGPGTATLSDVKVGMPNAPLTQISPGVWHLRANLVMENGARLLLHGTKIGGDVNQLRLQSNNTGETNAFIYVTADWGSIDIRSTSITSWDDAVNGPDEESGPFRRAFIRVRSSLDPDGVTPHESRMDIVDSDVGYLGSHDAEAYGLVWKVIEPETASYGSITNLYNLVNVYGDIIHSRLHHNYFGMYSFGAYGMQMVNNEADHNVGYGFDPHDDSDYLVIENNNVHHNGWHGIIASQRCNNVIVRNNVCWQNGHNGIMLHRYCDDSLIENNRCLDNGDSGLALFDNSRTIVRGNICLRNLNAGIRLSVGAADNLIVNNEFAEGARFGLYLYKGGDLPFPGDDGHCKRNRFINNRVHHNASSPIFLTMGDDNLFAGNIFEANGAPIRLIDGQRNRFESNSIPRELIVNTQGEPSFPASTMVRNQPALTIQVDPFSVVTFDDNLRRVFDPEEPGIATSMKTTGSSMALTTVEVGKTSYVQMRNFQVSPDAGSVQVTVTAWNIAGGLNKGWLARAASTTRRITYTIGDLTPDTDYQLYRNGLNTVPIQVTSDSNGRLTYQETSVNASLIQYDLRLDL